MRCNGNLSKKVQELGTTNERKHCQNSDELDVDRSIRAPGDKTSCKVLFKEDFRNHFH